VESSGKCLELVDGVLAQGGRLDWMISEGPFQPTPFYYSAPNLVEDGFEELELVEDVLAHDKVLDLNGL